MEEGAALQTETPEEAKHPGGLRQAVRFVLHLAAVYVIVYTASPWLTGRMYMTVLPLVLHHPPTTSSLEFEFSHLFLFNFASAMLVAFVYSVWFPHRVALYVWLVPTVILAYKLATYPTSVFQDHWALAFHEYFSSDFLIGEFHSYKQLFQLGGNSDFVRAWEQLRFTAPVYAAFGYSFGAWLGMRARSSKLGEALSKAKPGMRPTT